MADAGDVQDADWLKSALLVCLLPVQLLHG
jgi:hypothetical protein